MPEQTRHHRQELLAGIGSEGQAKLRSSHALVIGCGALGCAIIDILARAGVGRLTIVDRDIVEETNLQRQTLFTHADAQAGVPKASAAKARVAAIDPSIECRGWCEHFGPDNALAYMDGCDIVLDGLDNLHTRFLINDASVSLEIPYIYGGAVATRGMSMPILPGEPCLRCIFPDPTLLQSHETCDTVGVLMSTVLAVSAHQSAQAIKWLAGARDAIDRSMWSIDSWSNRTSRVALPRQRDGNCPCCGARKFEFLNGAHESRASVICGRNAVQIAPTGRGASIDLNRAAVLLGAHGAFSSRSGLLVGTLNEVRSDEGTPIELTIFPDGRAIIRGSVDEVFARGVYDRFVGGI